MHALLWRRHFQKQNDSLFLGRHFWATFVVSIEGHFIHYSLGLEKIFKGQMLLELSYISFLNSRMFKNQFPDYVFLERFSSMICKFLLNQGDLYQEGHVLHYPLGFQNLFSGRNQMLEILQGFQITIFFHFRRQFLLLEKNSSRSQSNYACLLA